MTVSMRCTSPSRLYPCWLADCHIGLAVVSTRMTHVHEPISLRQGLVVPRWLYYWAMAERRYPSFTALEKRMLILFFYWAVRV